MVKVVKRVVSHCRDGKEHEEIPFINSLLQNYDDEDKVNLPLSPSLSLPPLPCSLSRINFLPTMYNNLAINFSMSQSIVSDCVRRDQLYGWRIPHLRLHVHMDALVPCRKPRLPGEAVGGA